jgi:hypothetical protein
MQAPIDGGGWMLDVAGSSRGSVALSLNHPEGRQRRYEHDEAKPKDWPSAKAPRVSRLVLGDSESPTATLAS